MLFSSPVKSSPVINGNSLIFGDDSGYVYSLDIEKYQYPGSVQLYYTLAIIAAVIVIVIAVIFKVKGRK